MNFNLKRKSAAAVLALVAASGLTVAAAPSASASTTTYLKCTNGGGSLYAAHTLKVVQNGQQMTASLSTSYHDANSTKNIRMYSFTITTLAGRTYTSRYYPISLNEPGSAVTKVAVNAHYTWQATGSYSGYSICYRSVFFG